MRQTCPSAHEASKGSTKTPEDELLTTSRLPSDVNEKSSGENQETSGGEDKPTVPLGDEDELTISLSVESCTFHTDISPVFSFARTARREPSGLNFIEEPPTGIRRESNFSTLRPQSMVSSRAPMLNHFPSGLKAIDFSSSIRIIVPV